MQSKGLNRNTIDKFYTRKSIVKICMKLIKENITIKTSDLIIEPSAGNGSFIKYIKRLSNNYKFYDIKAEHKDIIQQDYLELDYSNLINSNKRIHIIGNPPFGRQSSLAIKFIKKSCEYCDSISFILPKSFKKDSMKRYFNEYFHLKYEYDLPENSFRVNKMKYNVPCVFQIWIKKKYKRDKVKKLIPKKFIFVKKENNPDISFRRVGVNAGNISLDIKDKSIQSHYFIKFIDQNINEIIDKLNNIVFNHDNTVGPKSISKQELIKEFNKIL